MGIEGGEGVGFVKGLGVVMIVVVDGMVTGWVYVCDALGETTGLGRCLFMIWYIPVVRVEERTITEYRSHTAMPT